VNVVNDNNDVNDNILGIVRAWPTVAITTATFGLP
jgi:hypothetical protein